MLIPLTAANQTQSPSEFQAALNAISRHVSSWYRSIASGDGGRAVAGDGA